MFYVFKTHSCNYTFTLFSVKEEGVTKNYLNLCKRDLLVKLKIAQLNKFSPCFMKPVFHCHYYKTASLIPIASRINAIHTYQPINFGSILILSSYLCLFVTRSLFPSGFLTKNLYTFLFCAGVLYVPHIKLVTTQYSVKVTVLKFLIKQFSTVSCYVIHLRSKYFRQYLFFSHFRFMLLM